MNNLSIFQFESHAVRTIEKDNEPWFVAKDLCQVLEIGNVSQALTRLDEDEKGIISTDTLGGKQDTAIVSESGMYALVLSSRKPAAKPFRKWVTSEVLPQIRKTGQYSLQTPTTGELLVQMANLYKEQQDRLDLIQSQMALESQRTDDLKELVEQHDAELDRVFHPDGNYFSIRGWAKLKGLNVNITEANRLGRRATKLSNQLGFSVDELPDPRYGKVNSYSEHILSQIL